MWKPGTEKPSVASHENQLRKTPPNKGKTPPNKGKTPSNQGTTPLSQKKLSGSTMGMRFMQKRNYASPGPVAASPSSKSCQESADETQMVEQSNSECSNSDMYGIHSDLIGRRSFGGFKKSVDNNWRACLHGEDEQNKKPKITDEELLRQYEKLKRGSDPNNRNGRKRRPKNFGPGKLSESPSKRRR